MEFGPKLVEMARFWFYMMIGMEADGDDGQGCSRSVQIDSWLRFSAIRENFNYRYKYRQLR